MKDVSPTEHSFIQRNGALHVFVCKIMMFFTSDIQHELNNNVLLSRIIKYGNLAVFSNFIFLSLLYFIK